MNPNVILAILRKDLLDAIRDARVLVALLVPLGIAVFYNFVFDDETATPNATVAYTAGEPTELPERLESVTDTAVELTFDEYADAAEVRARVAEEEADVGLIIPPGFDAAVAQGASPPLDVILPEDPGLDSEYVLSALSPALLEMAGRGPPATIQIDTSALEEGSVSVAEELGPRTYVILSALLMFIVFVALLAMPVTLTEEVEKKTIEALALIASYADIIVAKALLGITYVAIGSPFLLWLTDQVPDDPVTFVGAVALTSVTLIGFGLFIGVLFRNANQLNTWAGVYLLPVIAPAFMVGLPLPDALDTALLALPTSQAMRLLVNGISGEQLFSNAILSWLVIAAWGVAGYGLLSWRLSRQSA